MTWYVNQKWLTRGSDASAEIKGCFGVKREEYSRLKEEHVQRSSGRRETDT